MNYNNWHNDRNRHSHQRSRKNRSRSGNKVGNLKLESQKIEDEATFIPYAKKFAGELEPKGKNQIRKFYNEFTIAIDNQNTFKLRMLLPKIHYQKSRKVLKDNMAKFLKELIEWAVESEKLEKAKDFFTAVYGFYGEGK